MNLNIFFFNDTATTEIYTLSLHDALPISRHFQPLPAARRGRGLPASPSVEGRAACVQQRRRGRLRARSRRPRDRKSTRLNSSHANISYAVFCLKKKDYRRWCKNRRAHV